MRSLRLCLLLATLFTVTGLRAQNVLVQVFTNTDCGNCKTPDNALDLYMKSHPNVVTVFIHNNFPSKTDPFYLASKSASDYQSVSFYGVVTDPYAYVNGVDASTDFQTWKSTIESASNTYPGQVTVAATPQASGAKLTVHLSGTSLGHSVKLRIAMTESGINFDNKQSFGNPAGVPVWNDVFRTMLPSASGDAAFVLNGQKDVDVNLDTAGTGWNLANMRAIAYLQQDLTSLPVADSAPIFGLGYLDLATLSSVGYQQPATAHLESAIPNPFYGKTDLSVEVAKPGQARLILTNVIGSKVATVTEPNLHVGKNVVHLDLSSLPAGMYEAHLFVGGVFIGATKLVSLR